MKKPICFTAVLLLMITLTSCGNKKNTGTAPIVLKSNEAMSNEAIPDNEVLDGEYEYYGGPTDAGYLYHKLKLTKNNRGVSGTLYSGYYMSKAEQGYYTMPTGTITSAVTGSIVGKNQVMLYLGTVQDSSLMEDEGQMPDQHTLFKRDDQGDAAAVLYKSGKNYIWMANHDSLVFEKSPAIEVE